MSLHGNPNEQEPALTVELESRHTNGHSFNAELLVSGSEASSIARIYFSESKEIGKITMLDWHPELQVLHTAGSGRWTLCSGTETLAVASKKQFWRRNFVISIQGDDFVMYPNSFSDRDFEVKCIRRRGMLSEKDASGQLVGRLIAGPGESKTYRLTFAQDVNMVVTAFCLWLANLMNKRYDTMVQANLLYQ